MTARDAEGAGMEPEYDIRGGERGKYLARYMASRQQCYGTVHFWWFDNPLCECGKPSSAHPGPDGEAGNVETPMATNRRLPDGTVPMTAPAPLTLAAIKERDAEAFSFQSPDQAERDRRHLLGLVEGLERSLVILTSEHLRTCGLGNECSDVIAARAALAALAAGQEEPAPGRLEAQDPREGRP